MSVQILGADGVSVLSTISVGGGKSSALVTPVRSDGSEVDPVFIGEYYASQNIPQFSGALAANSALFAVRNGATRRMKMLTMELSLAFAGTAAATTMQVSVRRFTAATPTGGTAITIAQEDSASSASTVADARYCAAGTALTITGVTVGAPIFVASLARGATGGVFNFEMSRDVILNINEGLLVQYDTVGVIGDSVGCTMYWGELL